MSNRSLREKKNTLSHVMYDFYLISKKQSHEKCYVYLQKIVRKVHLQMKEISNCKKNTALQLPPSFYHVMLCPVN